MLGTREHNFLVSHVNKVILMKANFMKIWVITKCKAARHAYNSKFRVKVRVCVEIWVRSWSRLVIGVVLCV